MIEDLTTALKTHQAKFDVSISDACAGSLAQYYDYLQSRNEHLHLVAPCSVEEFAVRHILEPLFVAGKLPPKSVVADVGAGAGLPGIPLALFREDLRVILIESKGKKAQFLSDAVRELGIAARATVANSQFEEASVPSRAIITARALDKFALRLPRLIRWAGKRRLILFGGPGLEEALTLAARKFMKTRTPMSEQRFVFDVGERA